MIDQKDIRAVDALLMWLSTSEEVEVRATNERADAIAVAIRVAVAAFERIKAELVTTNEQGSP